MITYIEDKSEKYPPRTFANAARADMTIAFAIDFNTRGEKLTELATKKAIKPYIALNPLQVTKRTVALLCGSLEIGYIKSINIAGNSIYSLAGHISQTQCDTLIRNVIYNFVEHGIKLNFICSGGQSGFDEAGIKAAIKFDIPAICHCPKGWPFITPEGLTIRDERLFKKRFGL